MLVLKVCRLLQRTLALTQISGNSAGNLRARFSVRFRKFPWKFATAGGRVVQRNGAYTLAARRDQPLAPTTFLSIAEVLCHTVRGHCSWTSMSDMRAALSAARDAGDISLIEYLAELGLRRR